VTINLTDVTFDLLVAEQLHDIVPCDDCEATAHWSLHCSNPECDVVDLVCGEHRREFDEAVARTPKRNEWACDRCDTAPALPVRWVAL